MSQTTIKKLTFTFTALALACAAEQAFSAYSAPAGIPANLATKADYTLFETVPVRPLALSADRQWLYAVNTPDDRLEVYAVTASGLSHHASIPVGMRPVAVAVAPSGQVWVVNHLSDSVSVVDPSQAVVTATLLVGDEPRDIVFAGPAADKAFITTAHRGQNSPVDPQLSTPSVGRSDVWVFDAQNPGNGLQTSPLTILNFFADTPRALAASPDGRSVYVATLHSGNQTSAIHEGASPQLNEVNIHGEEQPHKGLIIKYIDGRWINAVGDDVSEQVNFSLPDYDVFTIDAAASVPVAAGGDGQPISGVGTTLFNLAVNPVSGALYVANTEADNLKRFEGPGLENNYNTTNRGNFVKSRITVINGEGVQPRHLNKHIDYTQCCDVVGNAEARRSLAFPRQMAVSSDGQSMYVAALGSGKIGVFDTAALENDTFEPAESAHIPLSAGGPVGVILDEARQRLYALTHFNNGVSVVDLAQRQEVQALTMHSPESAHLQEGRTFLYDAFKTSSHGDSACAGCHIDGDVDHLAWDLGDPTLESKPVPGSWLAMTGAAILTPTNANVNAIETCALIPSFLDFVPCAQESSFHFQALKGPMATQTLAGMDNHGPMHWRGDRTGGSAAYGGNQPNRGDV